MIVKEQIDKLILNHGRCSGIVDWRCIDCVIDRLCPLNKVAINNERADRTLLKLEIAYAVKDNEYSVEALLFERYL